MKVREYLPVRFFSRMALSTAKEAPMLISKVFAEFTALVAAGKISEKMIERLIAQARQENPESRRLIALLSKDRLLDGAVAVVAGLALYTACRDGKQFVVCGNTEYKPYPRVSSVSVANSNPLFVAQDSNEQFVVWGYKEYKQYHRIFDLSAADNKPLYDVYYMDKWFVVWGDVEYKTYENVGNPFIVCGKPLYAAQRDGRWFVAWGDGDLEYKEMYDSISGLSAVNQVPLYVAHRGSKEFVVWSDIRVSGAYDQILDLTSEDGVHTFYGRRGRKLYEVTIKIR